MPYGLIIIGIALEREGRTRANGKRRYRLRLLMDGRWEEGKMRLHPAAAEAKADVA